MTAKACEVCGGATDDGVVCRACLLGNVVEGDEGLFELPEELGGFRIRERIGRGASGEVWRAFQPGPDREVALKVFLDHRLGGNADRSLFLREAQALGKLDHPGIVPVYATGEEGGFLFIASPWMSGGTLGEQIGNREYLGKQKGTAEAMIQVGRAVAHAHQHGLVHRDIKPANILIDGNGVPCLADFGIAITENEASVGVTSGTPAYMAPEQLAGEAVTTATDVWALGSLMHEMLTGKMPRDSPPGQLSAFDPRLRAIIERCLKDDPENRYAGAASLLQDLEAFLEGRCVGALPEGLWMRMRRWAQRHPAIAGAYLVGIALAFTALGLALNNWRITRENEKRSVADAAKFRQHAYVADVYLASRALADNQLGVARGMLERHVPREGETDLRGFEWHAFSAIAKGDDARVFKDHSAEVRALAFDSGGHHLLSAGRDGRLVVRDVASGDLVLILPKGDEPKEAGEIPMMTILTMKSPEAKSALFSGTVNADEIRMRGRPSKIGEIECAAWSPDGSRIITGSGGGYLRIWSFPEGEMIGFLPQYLNRQVEVSDDGRLLISLVGQGQEFELRVHDLETLSRVWTVKEVEPGFGLEGEQVAVVMKDGMRMRILDMRNGREIRSWQAEGISQLHFSDDGAQLHGISGDRRMQLLWSAENGRLLQRKKSPDGAIGALAIHGQRSVIAGEAQVLRLQQGLELKEWKRFRGHENEILALALSPDGLHVASAGKDQSTRIWKVPKGEGGPARVHGYGSQFVALAPDGRSWLVQREGEVEVWTVSGQRGRLAGVHQALGYSKKGDRFATWRKEQSTAVIEWWDLDDAAFIEKFEIKLHAGAPWVFGWGPQGTKCAVSVGERYVSVFDPRDASLIAKLDGPDLQPLRLMFSPNGSDLLAWGWPWHVQIGGLRRSWSERWKISKGSVGPIVFSPDGSLLVSGSDENRIAIRDVESGELVKELSGHRARLDSLVFTPDGRTLVSSSADRTLRLWHVPTWRDLGILDEGVLHGCIGFDREGERLTVVPPGAPPFAIPDWGDADPGEINSR